MHQPHNQSRHGFTLVELLFAMSFITVLLLLILTATIQISRIYNKGVTLKQANQTGQAVGQELESSIQQAHAPIDTTAEGQGRLCLGTYSYVWNKGDVTTNQYVGDTTRIGLVKVNDSGGKMCTQVSGKYPDVPKASAQELVLVDHGAAGGVQLIVDDLNVAQGAVDGINYLYTVTYTISTDDPTLIDKSGICSGGQNDEFCALNRFELTVDARGGQL